MSAIDGLFLPLRSIINLKTDAPDGIELGGKEMKKKRLLIIAIITTFLLSIMSSCAVLADPYFQEGFRYGWNSACPPGYEYLKY